MALILNIDTSSSICSVCLAEDGHVIAERNEMGDNKHASMLTSLIRELLKECNIRLGDLSAVALSSGPGSYTGLRIGASVAKGICYGLGKPLISVSTLKGLAHTMSTIHPDPNGIYIPMLDARRDDVYMAIYDADNCLLEKDSFATVDVGFADTLSRRSVKNIYFGGPGASKMDVICLNMEFGIVIENLICVASNINTISYKQHKCCIYDDITYFEPFYLKEFEGRMKVS